MTAPKTQISKNAKKQGCSDSNSVPPSESENERLAYTKRSSSVKKKHFLDELTTSYTKRKSPARGVWGELNLSPEGMGFDSFGFA